MAGDVDFQLLFEASPDVLLVLLPDAPRFTMVAATRARHAATGTTPEQILGKGLFEIFPDNPDDPSADGTRQLRASLMRVIATRAPDTMAVQKYDIRGDDGSFVAKYWSPRNIPVLSSGGDVRFILHRVEEVTDLVRASEEGRELRDQSQKMEREVIARSRELATVVSALRDANARLGELDTAKTAFFSNVSHEFRTPLTLMLGPLEDALTDSAAPLSAAQRARVQAAHDNSQRLLKLVNALLDFSRLEAGRLKARCAPLDIGTFTAELAGMFRSAFDRAGLSFEVDCPRLSEPVWVDRDMWEKVVPNLVSNALKFTHAGGVTVRVREQKPSVLVEVADTGIGIPEAELSHVFDRFHRVAGAKGRTHEGAGIGLSLVRELAALHGGKVEVESTPGRGSTFRVEIPKGFAHLPPESVSHQPVAAGGVENATAFAVEATRLADASRATRPEKPGTGSRDHVVRPRVLLVDDNADLRHYMSELLAPAYEVVTACDGQEAVERLDAGAPDIIVSDVMMPRLDGFGLVRAVRARPDVASVPVILLSARAGEESAVEGLDAGADDYLVKPFAARELLARVRTHVELARARKAWLQQLEAANRELDAFSYSVSHDLRAPLRAIEGFTQALIEESVIAKGSQASDYLERIARGAHDMGVLIADLLELAKLSRAPLEATKVDLAALAAEVVADLRAAHPARNVALEVSPSLEAVGDRNLLKIVLVNLIGNAWKFSSKNPEPRIEVGVRPGDEQAFYVRDNGAGFDAAHASRLFAPFQRLHRPEDFEGTGIGLATVQRIVARHGGRVWAEGAVGKGATFFFTVPSRSVAP